MSLIEAGLEKLKNDMENMTENEMGNKRLNLLANFIGEVLIGDIITDMPPLEPEEDAAERQRRQGLKLLTPRQMITRLPILLAQLKAENNSQKLKNEIRQLLYHLHRSKILKSLNTTTTNLKFLHQLGMMNLIYPMNLILFLIFKIILNKLLENMKILRIILLYKFM